MQVNLNEPLLPCQDSYLGNMYLGSETYGGRHSVAFALATGFPSAGAAPPGIGKRLESHVGQTAHHGTDLSSPGAENCRRPAARAAAAAHPDPPFGRSTDGRTDDHVAAPNGGYRARRVGRSRRSCGAIRPEELVRHLALPGHQGPDLDAIRCPDLRSTSSADQPDLRGWRRCRKGSACATRGDVQCGRRGSWSHRLIGYRR